MPSAKQKTVSSPAKKESAAADDIAKVPSKPKAVKAKAKASKSSDSTPVQQSLFDENEQDQGHAPEATTDERLATGDSAPTGSKPSHAADATKLTRSSRLVARQRDKELARRPPPERSELDARLSTILPPLKVNVHGRYHYLEIYESKWIPAKRDADGKIIKEAYSKPTNRRSVATIVGNKNYGYVRFRDKFLKDYPELRNYDVYRHQDATFTFVLRDEPLPEPIDTPDATQAAAVTDATANSPSTPKAVKAKAKASKSSDSTPVQQSLFEDSPQDQANVLETTTDGHPAKGESAPRVSKSALRAEAARAARAAREAERQRYEELARRAPPERTELDARLSQILPPLKVNTQGKYHYLVSYESKWTPAVRDADGRVIKESYSKTTNRRNVGTMINNKNYGYVKLREKFLKEYPELRNYDLYRHKDATFSFVLRDEEESATDSDSSALAQAANSKSKYKLDF